MSSRMAGAALTAMLILGSAPLAETDTAAPGPWQTWSRLRLKAHGFPLFFGRFEMIRPSGGNPSQLETRSTASIFGQRVAASRTLTTFDESTGRTARFLSQSRKRAQRYEFGETSYSVEKLAPPPGGPVPLEQWSVTSRREFAYPAEDGPLFDYYGMLLHLREVHLHAIGDEVTLNVATADGPQPFRIRVDESRVSQCEYTDLTSGKEKTVSVREFRLRITPADPARAGEGFLHMEGETEIWVEAGSKTPLEISGKVPKVPGRVRLLLNALE